jgi:hypothetical protein
MAKAACPGPDFKQGYAEKTDFKIGLVFQSKMRANLQLISSRPGGHQAAKTRKLSAMELDLDEDEFHGITEDEGPSVVVKKTEGKRKVTRTGLSVKSTRNVRSKGYVE